MISFPRLRGRIATLAATLAPFVVAAAASLPAPGRAQSPSSPTVAIPAMAQVPDSLLAPGVSRALALHRAATLSGVRYDLLLDVTDSAMAKGSVTIAVTRAPGAADLVLDFRGTALDSLSVNGGPVLTPDTLPSRAATDRVALRNGHVVVPAAMLHPGANTIEARFLTPIAPAGASIIRFDDASDGARYLYTLLVPADAEQLFPCFDQPDLKARVTLHIVAPDDSKVLANGPLAARMPAAAGTARWDFSETRPISTYLIAFAAGPWATFSSRGEGAEDRGSTGTAGAGEMTLYVRASRAAEVDADTILRINRDARAWLEAYFARPYPFAKMDVLLAPAFPFGGMEHAGAIFYNESSFIFREKPTLSRRLGRASTMYHEVTHQWFGDLVTMRWFDDLWLKEGFATYMAAKVQADLSPDAGAWKTFYLRNKPAAYAVDATAGTTPVWQELANLDQAKSNYGAIVYNKAPAVLKQLNFLAGDDAFREGLRAFLDLHAYANATWRDLLDEVGRAADMDLTSFGEQYILRAGMPLVETELTLVDGRVQALTLTQRPVRALEGDPGGWWPGRVRVRLGYTDTADVVLPVSFDGPRTIVKAAAGLPAPDYVFPNDGDYGYGLFLPDARSARWLLEHAGSLRDDLLRAMAWGALWDLVRERRLEPATFVSRAIAALPHERDEQIAGALTSRAGFALERYVLPGSDHDHLAAATEALLLERAGDDSLSYGMRRSALDAFLSGATTSEGVAVLREFLNGTRLFDGKPLQQPSRWTAVTRLLALDAPDARSLYAAEQARDSTPEAGRMAFIAGAAIPTAASKQSYWDRYFNDPSLNEEWVTASLGAFDDPLHASLTLRYLRPSLEKAEWIRDNRRIFFLPRWIGAFVEGQVGPQALRIVDEFLDHNADLPDDVRRRILQSRDELERTVQIRRAAAEAGRMRSDRSDPDGGHVPDRRPEPRNGTSRVRGR